MVGSPQECLVCAGVPSVVIAVNHRALRRLTIELLQRDRTRWQVHAVADRRNLASLVTAADPDLIVLDDGNLGWRGELLPAFAPQHIIVIGPEPDPAYELAARRAGAGAWLCCDQVGEDLIASMRSVLGCTHDTAPNPPADSCLLKAKPCHEDDATPSETQR